MSCKSYDSVTGPTFYTKAFLNCKLWKILTTVSYMRIVT